MIRFLKSLYFRPRFFYTLFGLAVLFFLAFWVPDIYPYCWVLFFIFGLLTLIDALLVYKTGSVSAKRELSEKFSNSDENPVRLYFKNNFPFDIQLSVIDELPEQFQKRDFFKTLKIKGKQSASYTYSLHPVDRGEYHFGRLNVFASSKIKLIRKRFTFSNQQMVKVFPSFVQMKKYDFLALDNRQAMYGMKKIRRIGHTMEFEQVKEYVLGDDMRTINWKATAKQGNLMVNQYQDEKSQPVYSVIDTGRVMKMPFAQMKLLDYAINSSLAFSNVALKKNDKVGLVTFSKSVEQVLPANGNKTYLNKIIHSLYNVDTQFSDSDFGTLYAQLRRQIPQRSLLLLYTNFEHISSLRRQLPFFRAMAKKHVLVVIFFENTELIDLAETSAKSIPEIYDRTIAEQFVSDKEMMVHELQKNGIHTILTKPQELTVNTINKYLEIKKRGLL